MELVQRCTCRLSGPAHYARRCPRCGLWRDGYPHGWVPDRESWNRWRLTVKKYSDSLRRASEQYLDTIRALCMKEVKPPPRAKRPWNFDKMTAREQSQWYEKATHWEMHAWRAAWESVMAPFEVYQSFTSLPPQRRYLKAAQRYLEEYEKRVRAAGWDPLPW